MKTRKRRLIEMCPCSPDVGDCNRCVRGILKKSFQKRHLKTFRRKLRSS